MPKSRIILVGLVGLVLGICLGSGFSYLWMKHELELGVEGILTANNLIDFPFVASEVEENMRQYFFSTPEMGIYALRRNIRILDHFKTRPAPVFGGPKVYAWDLTLSYVRLGKLLRKKQDEMGAKEAFANALGASVETGRRFNSVAELVEVVDRLDSAYRQSVTTNELSDRDKEQR